MLALAIVTFSCKKDIKVDFTEFNIEASEDTEISINYPKAIGDDTVAKLINKTLESYIINQTNLEEKELSNISVGDAIKRFNEEFNAFKKNFPDSSQKWELLIDGEVTYRSLEVICIALNSYVDTGGAHGNTNVRFFNFNPTTGQLISKEGLIDDIDALSKIIANSLKANVLAKDYNQPMEDFFFGKGFQLPETIGFSDEGLIILYNPYEIASYAQGIIEFTIPYEEVSSFLKVY